MVELIAHYEGAGLPAPADVIRADLAENDSLYYLASGTGEAQRIMREDPALYVVRASPEVGRLIEDRQQEFPESPWDEAEQPCFTLEVYRQEPEAPRELRVALLTHAVLMDVLFESGTSGKYWVRKLSSKNVSVVDKNEHMDTFYRSKLRMKRQKYVPCLGKTGLTLVSGYEANADELLDRAGDVIGRHDIKMGRELPAAVEAGSYHARRVQRLQELGVTEETLDSLYETPHNAH